LGKGWSTRTCTLSPILDRLWTVLGMVPAARARTVGLLPRLPSRAGPAHLESILDCGGCKSRSWPEPWVKPDGGAFSAGCFGSSWLKSHTGTKSKSWNKVLHCGIYAPISLNCHETQEFMGISFAANRSGTEERTMTTLEAFLLGMMVAWTPSLVLLGWLLHCARYFRTLEDHQNSVTDKPA
jgi:hypothetical protein